VVPTGLSGKPTENGDPERAVISGLGGKRRPALRRFTGDNAFYGLSLVGGLSVLFFIAWIGFQLYSSSAESRHAFGWSLLAGDRWDVNREIFGAWPYMYYSIVAATISMVVAVPLSVGCAVFLTQYAPPWIAKPVAFFLDLLAAVPSIIFGLWGFIVMCPFLQEHVNPWLVEHFGKIPIFSGPAVMNNVLAAGLILALMILPFVTAVSREVLLAMPAGYKEASMGLGATKWETIRSTLLPASTSGIVGAAILGLGRAVGETMAAVLVIGNNYHIKASILQQGYSMPALLANEFNEAQNVPMHRSALIEIALILFVFTFILNALARLLIRLTSKTGSRHESVAWVTVTKRLLGSVGKYAAYIAVGGFVLLQVISDLRTKGVAGLFGPIEVAVILYAGVRIAAHKLCDTKHWGTFRKANNGVMRGVAGLTALVACIVLFLVLGFVVKEGLPGLNLDLFTQLPKPPGEPGGGLKMAIVGTLILISIAGVIGIPIGVLGGVFLSEYPESKFVFPIRFAADVLSGIPSVVIGLFAYAAFVVPVKHFSALAGGAALGIMMIPTIIRVTDEMMRLVPHGMREASVGLGATRMQTTLRVILPGARKGVMTGILLSVARVAGETAPLLFTAFGTNQFSTNLKLPISSLTMKIYEYAGSAYKEQLQQAWSGALVLVLIILVLSLTARLATRNKFA